MPTHPHALPNTFSERREIDRIRARRYRLNADDHVAFAKVTGTTAPPVDAMEADTDARRVKPPAAERPQHRTRDLIADAIGIACLFGLLGAFLFFTP